MDGMKEKIGLWDCEGYCIGDMVHDGCRINQDKKSDDMVEVKIDFTKTDVDMCSLVIYPEKKDWHRWAESEKDISMNIEADNSILKMGLEIRISGRDYLYNLPNPEGTVRVPLKKICPRVDKWESVEQVHFLVLRNNVTGGKGTYRVSGMAIE